MIEQWKEIKGFEGLYEVSNTGKVKALERKVMNNGGLQKRHEKILKPSKSKYYLSVVLCKDGKTYPKTIHRLVAEAFISNPENKPVVDHIDANTENNCVDNLRWVTQKENCLNPITRKNNSLSKMGHKGYLTHHTEESKKKMSEKAKGRKLTEEQKKHLNEIRGKHWKVEGGKRVWY